MGGRLLETLIGAVVLAAAAGFLGFVWSSTEVGTVQGYELVAKFDRVDGLGIGSDVRLAGIKVGSVVDQELEPETYLAVVRMSVDPAVQIPTDSSAKIASDGLLGHKYLSLAPGADEEILPPGGVIQFTQSSVDLIDILGQAIFGQAQSSEDKGGSK